MAALVHHLDETLDDGVARGGDAVGEAEERRDGGGLGLERIGAEQRHERRGGVLLRQRHLPCWQVSSDDLIGGTKVVHC